MKKCDHTGPDGAADRARLDALLRRYCDATACWLETAAPAALRQRLEIVEARLARERNKGVGRHWSYDLNRHIALKQVRDLIASRLAGAMVGPDRLADRSAPEAKRAATVGTGPKSAGSPRARARPASS